MTGVLDTGVLRPDVGVAAIEVQNLTVSYGKNVVLRDASCSLPAHQWTVLLGANGVGKSSLLHAIVGIGRGSDAIRFPGRDPRTRRSTFLAFVPQNPALPPGMTVAEYVLLGRTAHLGWLRGESQMDRDRAAAAMHRLEVERFSARLLSELSGGEAQRVVLARALCQDAEILVLDEPTTSLDIGRQMAVLDLVAELARSEGLTVVSALHDLTSAARYGHHFVLLGNSLAGVAVDGDVAVGGVVAGGSADEIMQPALLSQHFGTALQRIDGPDGHPILVPFLPRSTPTFKSANAESTLNIP